MELSTFKQNEFYFSQKKIREEKRNVSMDKILNRVRITEVKKEIRFNLNRFDEMDHVDRHIDKYEHDDNNAK